METPTPIAVVLGLVVLVLIVGLTVIGMRRRCSARRGGGQGEEYRRTFDVADNGHRGGGGPYGSAYRTKGFDTHVLSPMRRDRYVRAWQTVQTRYAIDPGDAVTRADLLLGNIMVARGFPIAGLDQRADDLPIDHGEAVAYYRTGHAIAESVALGRAGPEELRRAMIHYRALFDDLVNEPVDFAPVIEHRNGRIHDLRRETTRRG